MIHVLHSKEFHIVFLAIRDIQKLKSSFAFFDQEKAVGSWKWIVHKAWIGIIMKAVNMQIKFRRADNLDF